LLKNLKSLKESQKTLVRIRKSGLIFLTLQSDLNIQIHSYLWKPGKLLFTSLSYFHKFINDKSLNRMHTPLLKKFHKFTYYIFIFLLHLPFVFAKKAASNSSVEGNVKPKSETSFTPQVIADKSEASGYDGLKLNTLGLSKQAYDYAMQGYNYLRSLGKLTNDKIISIVDFSLESNKKRLFVLDLENNKVLFNTYVAHGRNSGREYASQFSNENESYMSSLGFYVTHDTYNGKHGYSLRLEGEEKGINDNALNRAIVMHSAWYVNENIAKTQGYIGRSQGCPALPEELSKPIIEKIKNGSCLFLYSPDKNYLSHSQILQIAKSA
jgi:hypothetical protein